MFCTINYLRGLFVNILEKINEVSMEIIMDAGDGREQISKAFDAIEQGDFILVSTLLKEAEEKIKKAHVLQTNVIQAQMEQSQYEISLLFVHAQDTLMTINSELLMAKRISKLFEKVMNH